MVSWETENTLRHAAGFAMGTEMDAEMSSGIFTVPLGANFLDEIASGVLNGQLPRAGGTPPDLLSLPDITILLPTRRAARALQEAFLRAGNGRALLLPQIRPIGESDEDRQLISGLADTGGVRGDLEVPPAIGELERRLVLTQLVQRWSEQMRSDAPDGRSVIEPYASAGARTPAQAVHLAADLCQLIDMIETEGVPLDRLSELVPDSLAEHWQRTVQFLEIVVNWWPQQLEEVKKLSPADRRNRLVMGEVIRLRNTQPTAPIIVAGVTGSIPATAELMKAVAALPQGAIVLPGLDTVLDEESWAAVATSHPEHPQFGLAQLLAALEVKRADIQQLGSAGQQLGSAGQQLGCTEADEKLAAVFGMRDLILSETMRPAPTTDLWHNLSSRVDKDQVQQSLAGVTQLTAPTAQDEAEAIALILREAAETPGQTAALISPDRLLARRVGIRLEGWGIRVDDSAGRPFAKTVPGSFLDLVVAVSAEAFAPKPLMALLKHPLTRLGVPAAEIRRAGRALELIAFRAPYLGYGLDGIEAAVERAVQEVADKQRRGQAVGRLWEADWQAARDLIQRLRVAYAPLMKLAANKALHELHQLTKAHIETAEALARRGRGDTETSELWRDEAGQTAALLFANLIDEELHSPQISMEDYPEFYRALIASEAVRPSIPTHPRIFIWGPFEARLQKPDVVVLGSLNEGTWPSTADPGPWLNRPMRMELGLPLPEEKIGHAAHDVVQLFGARRVYLTRAEKVDGDPTVPSRWLLRLGAVLAGLDASDALAPKQPWLAWARSRDMVSVLPPIKQPEPRPPLAMRPRRLSVSAIEKWIANPYALFAQRILKLEALPLLGDDPGANLRGSIVHEALGRFATTFPEKLPPDPARELLAIATKIFATYNSHPRIRAFWVERFRRFAEWFGEMEPQFRDGVLKTLGEINGSYVLEGPAGPFTMTARADRIDLQDKGILITDYKTGAQLSNLASKAKTGVAPQLLLEAVIAISGGFGGVPKDTTSVESLRFISASGGEPPGALVTLKIDDITAEAKRMEHELQGLIAKYDNQDTPYRAMRRGDFNYDYDDYEHLARVAEWSTRGGEGGRKTEGGGNE